MDGASNLHLPLRPLYVRRPFRPSAIAKVTAVDELMLREFLAKYTKKVEG